jgi:hypothetical protein
MESSQHQRGSVATQHRQLKPSGLESAIADVNARPTCIPDTNITTVSSQITNSMQIETADGIKSHDCHHCVLNESASDSENEEILCRNHLKQEAEQPLDGVTCVQKEVVSHDAKWEVMFNRLLKFKKIYGHCLVPNRYKNDNKLGSWVSTQRKQYKALTCGRYDTTILPIHRIKKLDEIGFVWNTSDPRRVDWEVRYSQLKDFFREHGM